MGVVIGATAVSAGAVSTAPAPSNDAYLFSSSLNRPGQSKLSRTLTYKDTPDTTNASTQANILDPCQTASCPAGPAEVTRCGTVNYGNTVWYDFYPDADGHVVIRTTGFDNVITLYTFNPQTALPDETHRVCMHSSSFPSEQLYAPVKKGLSYTFQIGGVVGPTGPAAGPLQMLLDYVVPQVVRLKADATLTARATSNGISILGLTVAAPHRGARVEVSCPGHCATQSRTVPKRGSTTLGFRRLAGIALPAGAQVVIRVTARNAIGAAIRYTAQRGNVSKQSFCMEPGSRKLRSTCH